MVTIMPTIANDIELRETEKGKHEKKRKKEKTNQND